MTGTATMGLGEAGLSIVLPEGWWRVPLEPLEARRTSVGTLVDRQFRGVDDQPLLKRETERELLDAAQEAAESGGLAMWISNQRVLGYPLSAALVVSETPIDGPDGEEGIAALAERLERRGGSVESTTVPAGRVVRHRRRGSAEQAARLGAPTTPLLVDYWLVAPAGLSYVLFAFSTPLDPLADAMTELFDAVVMTARFPEAS